VLDPGAKRPSAGRYHHHREGSAITNEPRRPGQNPRSVPLLLVRQDSVAFRLVTENKEQAVKVPVRLPLYFATVLAASIVWSVSALQPAVSAEFRLDDRVVEEVQVTALRREASLPDVPDAITVFDRTAIERAGIYRLNDVARLTPNLRFSDDQEVGVGTVTIRGVTQNRGIGETPVAFLVDGVSVNNSLLTSQDFFDTEQIEVLRGPQGALFGRNAVAGVINVASRRPTEEFEAYTRARVGAGNDYTLEGAVSGPLAGERVLGRVAGYFQTRDGQLFNNTIGEFVDYKDSASIRVWGRVKPTDGLALDLRYQHADQEGGSGYFMPGSVDNEENRLPGDTFAFPLNNTTYTIQSNLRGESDVAFDEYTLNLVYEAPWATFTSITGYNDLESNNDQDLDQTAQEFINIIVDDNATQFSQEFRFTSPTDRRVRWLAGVYLSDQTRNRSLATSVNVTGFATGGDWSSANAVFVPQPPAVLDERYDTRAAYAQFNIDLAQKWELILAGRYDRVERENNSSNPTANGEATFSELQPKLQLGYSPTQSLNLFVTYAEGFRPGGFNTLANAPQVQFDPRFDAETLTNYEIGAKYRSPAQSVSVNAAAFYMDYHGQQFFLFDPFGSQALINAGESYIAGGELEVSWLTAHGLTLAAAYGFTDSKIESMPQAPGLNVPVSQIEGGKVPNAPVYGLNLMADYRRPVGAYELSGRLELERRGKTYFTVDNNDAQEAYNIVNLRLSLAGEGWQLTGFLNNVFNEEWIEFFFSRRYIGLRTDIAWPSPERQAGLELTYSF